MKIVIINGPNLNLLGKREPAIYGTQSMEQILVDIQRAHMDVHFTYLQSNHEGDLIDWIQEVGQPTPIPSLKGMVVSDEAMRQEVIGVVLNAGGYTHTSVALRDAVACANLPVVEVHISDISQREEFRKVSLLTDVCTHSIIGHGTKGYLEAVEWLLKS
jgi:3-dehydroquinate dehydratase-2